MPAKEKILAALDCALDDISEDRLLDILLDAYQAKKKQLSLLEESNYQALEHFRQEAERFAQERHRMRTDLLAAPVGDYFFADGKSKFVVRVQGYRIDMFRRAGNVDHHVQQLAQEQWQQIT